jgi:lycopene cyclase domain-containing protein
MMPKAATYLFLEIALVLSVYLFTAETFRIRSLWRKEFAVRAAILFVLWLVIDEIAVHLGLWFFPSEGTLPVRIAGLPIEEHALFVLHTVICQMLVATGNSR